MPRADGRQALQRFPQHGGRIYYETHIAPLLRMQGYFEEFAIDMFKANGEPLQMIANAIERRDAGRQAAVHPTRVHQGDGSTALRAGASRGRELAKAARKR